MNKLAIGITVGVIIIVIVVGIYILEEMNTQIDEYCDETYGEDNWTLPNNKIPGVQECNITALSTDVAT